MIARRWAWMLAMSALAAWPAGAAGQADDEEENGLGRLEGSVAVGRGSTGGISATGARLGAGLGFGPVRLRLEAQGVGFDRSCTITVPQACNLPAGSAVTVDGGLDVLAHVWQDRLRPFAGVGAGVLQWQNDVISADGRLRAGADVRLHAPVWLRAEVRRDTPLRRSGDGPSFTMVWLGLRFGD